MAKFDIVVKHYRRPYLLQVCLESLRHFWPKTEDYKVIVADDGTDPLIVDLTYGRIYSATLPSLYNLFLQNPRGAGKWALARAGRFSEVAHTCGETWNAAYSVCGADYIFVIEDDSRLTRDFDPQNAIELLAAKPDVLCAIGLQQRVDLEASGFGARAILGHEADEHFDIFIHSYWPWSFDSIFFRRADWAKIGPWPVGISTAAMEGWVTGRLREVGFADRPYAVAKQAFSVIDEQSRVRVDPIAPGSAGMPTWNTYIHSDACLRAWVEGRFNPKLEDVLAQGSVAYPDWLLPENYR